MRSVAVIIPLYNKEATVIRTVNSVLSQTIQDLDIIIVDDGSTDNGVAAVRKIADSRIRLIQQENAGPGAARNAGAAHADAPLLAFLDADDEWSPLFLAQAVRALQEHPECDAFVAAYDTGPYRKEQKSLLFETGLEGPWRLDPNTPAKQIKRYVDACHSSCTVIRRDTFQACGGFFAADHCTYGEDSYLWLQIVLNRALFWCPRLLVNYHIEDSALGFSRMGRHPIRPALTHPEKLRTNCKATAAAALERLLAHYRFIETEKLSHQGALREILRLRRRYPDLEKRLFWRERRLELAALVNRWRARGARGSTVSLR
jgi:glycosyltransferase involved in cell wall biosynthesis